MRATVLITATAFFMISLASRADSKICELVAGNYLQDPGFTQRTPAGRLEHWSSTQHAGERSFAVDFDDAVLTITKTGTQPWLTFRQIVAADELAGKKLALTAELKLDLHDTGLKHGFTVGGGLTLIARSSSAEGRKLLLRSIFDHQPHLGKTDWETVQVVVQLPEKTGTVEAGFMHQAEGTLQIRNPSLQLVDESVEPCQLSPNPILGVPRPSSGLR